MNKYEWLLIGIIFLIMSTVFTWPGYVTMMLFGIGISVAAVAGIEARKQNLINKED